MPLRGPARVAILLLAALPAVSSPAAACQVESVAAGQRHTVVLRSDGTVWVQGATLGRGAEWSPDDPFLPTRVAGIDDAVAVAGSSLALRSDGTVWRWDRGLPEPVPGVAGATAVAQGGGFGLALLQDATVLAWGANDRGQLGDGTGQDSASPVPVSGLTGIVGLAAGRRHALALSGDGSVWAWGAGSAGQLGDGGRADRLAPVRVAGIGDAVAIAAGAHHSLAIRADGSVVAWGFNQFGEVGDIPVGATADAPVTVPGLGGALAVAAGEDHSLALLADGTLQAWGSNAFANLGDPALAATRSPVQVPGIADAVGVAAGHFHSAAVLGDATLVTWGANWEGQAAREPDDQRRAPVEIPVTAATVEASRDHQSFAVQGDGTLLAWGDNQWGELGTGGSGNGVPWPTSVGGGVTQVSSGYAHTLALLFDGSVFAWGDNSFGQIGPNGGAGSSSPVPVTLPGGATVVEVVAGGDVSLARRDDGTVLAWGADFYGQLGDGGLDETRSQPQEVPGLVDVVELAAGDGHVLARHSDGAVSGWGGNFVGQVGDGSQDNVYSPLAVVGLPAGATEIAAGSAHSLARLTSGAIWVWGSNAESQLGTSRPGSFQLVPVEADLVGDLIGLAAGGFTSLAGTPAGELRIWGRHHLEVDPAAAAPHSVPLPAAAAEASVGAAHVLARLDDGRVFGWGENWTGQIGQGTGDRIWLPVSSGYEGPPRDLGNMLRMVKALDGRIRALWYLSHDAVGFNLYRDSSPAFSTADLVGTSAGVELEDPDPAGSLLFYQVRGIDCAGNEGP